MPRKQHRASQRRRLGVLYTGCSQQCHCPSSHRASTARRRIVKLEKHLRDLTEDLRALNEELTLCKQALCVDSLPRNGTIQTDAYRSLWYLTHARAKQLEGLLVSHLGEDVVRPYLPYHAKFRALDRDLIAPAHLFISLAPAHLAPADLSRTIFGLLTQNSMFMSRYCCTHDPFGSTQ
ncbi:hypothetical protein C8Q70DRAFT_1055719 [Cubamyces menziesii]|nr:hypothetical protein C8Q70DRAFT_1055719 [Cubamyces menziesii]